METKETKENAVEIGVNTGLGFELPGQELRRPPRREVEEILVVHDPEGRLKSERVEEWLRAMPAWELTLEGQGITRTKDLPSAEVASLYTAFVTGYAGHLGLPVAVSVAGGVVMVTLYGPGSGDCMGGLTESVLELAHQIG